jgi:hypothetical protein
VRALLFAFSTFTQESSSVRAKIRDGHPDYAITAHSWPLFLYAGLQAQVDDVEKGLFRSALLIKVCFFSTHKLVAEF